MSFGFVVFGNEGEVVIDDSFPSYALTQTGSISVQVTTSFRHSATIQLTRPSSIPPLVVAKWPDNNSVFCFGVDMVGVPGAWTGVKLLMRSSSGTHTVPISYRLFTEPHPSTEFALTLLAEDESLAFSSNYRPLDLSIISDGIFGSYRDWTGRGPLSAFRYTNRPHPMAEFVLSFARFYYPVSFTRLSNYHTRDTAVCNVGYGYATDSRIRTMGIANTTHDAYWFEDSDIFVAPSIEMFIP